MPSPYRFLLRAEQLSPMINRQAGLFDDTAQNFTQTTDFLIEGGRYRRGELFVQNAKRTVRAGGVILDYGCGPGRISAMLAKSGFRVKGVDTSIGMLREARRQDLTGLSVEFEVITAGHFDFGTAAFDGIVCSSVIEYVPDPDRLLEQFHASLRRDGTLIFSYANRLSVWRQFSRASFSKRAAHIALQRNIWRWQSVREILKRSGFQVTDSPAFFDSPCDKYQTVRWASAHPFVGTLGLVVARRK